MSGHEMTFIQEAFDTNWVVPLGPKVNAFEDDLKAFCGREDKEVVALSAGTAAVHLALSAYGVGRGDEGVVHIAESAHTDSEPNRNVEAMRMALIVNEIKKNIV